MRINKKSLIFSIIKAVGIVGMVGVVVVAPNAAQAFELLLGDNKKKNKRTYAEYLRRSGYFKIEKKGNKKFVISLSEKGGQAYKEVDFATFITTPKKWDQKWHILMYDIPDSHRRVRLYIASMLKNIGLKPIQNSVYAYPYDLTQLAAAMRHEYPKVARLIVAATVDKIDGEDQLKKAFEKLIKN